MLKTNQITKKKNKIKPATPKLKPIITEYLSNSIKLEKLAQLQPIEAMNDTLEANLMLQQEDLIFELTEYKIRTPGDAIKILNVWANEETNPAQLTDQQKLVLNVQTFLKEHTSD